jgi:hypothetical protein
VNVEEEVRERIGNETSGKASTIQMWNVDKNENEK